MQRRLIIGCGYLGRRVAAHWAANGDKVTVLTRSPRHAADFESDGLHAVVGDVLDRGSLRSLPAADSLLYAVGYDRGATASKRTVYVDGLANVLEEVSHRIGRMVYASSTSVYPSGDAIDVDESTPPDPQTDGGRICLDAEERLRRTRPEATVIRYSGLYGPNRLLTRIAGLRGGEPMAGTGEEYLNLIHIDDAALVARLACDDKAPPLLLASDSRPVPRREFYERLARKVGAQPPTFSGEPRAKRPLSDRRCRTERLQRWLGSCAQVLAFPTLEAGLDDAVDRTDSDRLGVPPSQS